MLTLGILGSGSGSNMQAIQDAIASGKLRARIAMVLSDNPEAFILERAEEQELTTGVIDCGSFRSKFPEAAQKEAAQKLKHAGVDLVCLAGFLRLVKAPFLEVFPRRIVNIHPSLLPAFPGLEAWKQAIDSGVPETGVTVHVVDAGMDTGPILKQEVVPIFPHDSAETLHRRIQVAEHQLYPEAISDYAMEMGI